MKSERLRIWIVLAAIGGVFFLRFMRAVAVGGRENLMSLYMTAGLLALFAAYESAIMLRVDRAIQTRRDFTNWGLVCQHRLGNYAARRRRRFRL